MDAATQESVDIDRIFNWGEDNFMDLLPSHESSQDLLGYYARAYDNGNAVGEMDGSIYFYDGQTIALVGTVDDLLVQAMADGF
jgi:hypothetical protein